MKIARYRVRDSIAYGLVEGDSLRRLEGDIFTDPRPVGEPIAVSEVTLLSPVEPRNLVCVGLNYRLHAEESGAAIPEQPMLFMCSTAAVIADGDTIRLDSADMRIDFEAEIAIVVGREARNVPADKAADYILGYTICNDVSNRDLQRKDGQFTRAKSFDTYKPLGPWIETELDPDALEIRLWQNDILRQNSTTADMIFPVREIFEFVSGIMTLRPGDVIITGTPSGVGPMLPGDHIVIEIEGIGRLSNTVAA